MPFTGEQHRFLAAPGGECAYIEFDGLEVSYALARKGRRAVKEAG